MIDWVGRNVFFGGFGWEFGLHELDSWSVVENRLEILVTIF